MASPREAAIERGDERAAQDLDRSPEPKVGPTATAMERRGILTDRGDQRRDVLAQNAERQGLWQQVREWGEQVRDLARTFGQDVAERAKAAFRRGQDPVDALGERAGAKLPDLGDLAERAKAAFRQEHEARQATERARVLEAVERQAREVEARARQAPTLDRDGGWGR